MEIMNINNFLISENLNQKEASAFHLSSEEIIPSFDWQLRNTAQIIIIIFNNFNEILRMRIIKIALLLLMAASTMGKITLMSKFENQKLEEEDLINEPYVLVKTTLTMDNYEQFDISYFKLIGIGLNKRSTYHQFLKKYKKIVQDLYEAQVLPNEELMVHSAIQVNFERKTKKWEFTRVFIVYVPHEDGERAKDILEPYKLIKLDSNSQINYLNEKFVAIMAFTKAKQQLVQFLKEQMKTDLQIVSVKDIEIYGRKNLNSNQIQDDLEFEYNFSDDLVKNEKRKSKNSRKIDREEFFREPVTIKVVFKVGTKQEAYEARLKMTEEISELSVSSFEDQLNYQSATEIQSEENL